MESDIVLKCPLDCQQLLSGDLFDVCWWYVYLVYEIVQIK